MQACLHCKKPFDLEKDRVATICRSFMGDENIENWYLCPACDRYTLSSYWDSFSGSESDALKGPVSREEGDAKVALIRQCPKPWSKRCRCEAHMQYFDGRLD
jgi:hypothetical protein